MFDQALARNIAKMASLFAEEYKFVPKSYQARTDNSNRMLQSGLLVLTVCHLQVKTNMIARGCGVQLPAELEDFLAEFKPKKKRTWILKPDSGCQGKGIVLVQVGSQLSIPYVRSQSH